MKIFLLIISLAFWTFEAVGEELCVQPKLTKETAMIANSISSVPPENSGALIVAVLTNLPPAEADSLFTKLSDEHKLAFWTFKIHTALPPSDLSQLQRGFIHDILLFYKKMINGELSNLEANDALQNFELTSIDLFGKAKTNSIFYSVSSRNITDETRDNYHSSTEVYNPKCDCDTSSAFRCIGCTYKAQNCYWVSRGCGFLRMTPCNGKCPGR